MTCAALTLYFLAQKKLKPLTIKLAFSCEIVRCMCFGSPPPFFCVHIAESDRLKQLKRLKRLRAIKAIKAIYAPNPASGCVWKFSEWSLSVFKHFDEGLDDF